MSGSKPDNSALADAIRQASSPPSSGTAATEKSPAASGSTPSAASPFVKQLRLAEILASLKAPDQGNLSGYLAVGSLGATNDLLVLDANDISAAMWIVATNKIHLSSRSDGLITLNCSAINCPVPSWQQRLVLALFLGLVDWLPLQFEVSPTSPPS